LAGNDRYVLISSSARSDGDTMIVCKYLSKNKDWPIIDLCTLNISHYDYQHKNEHDDFIPLITNLVQNYDHLIFLTPIYWYTMSGMLKVFLDRISDLLTIRKDLGRSLKGKSMSVISVGNENNVLDGYLQSFPHSAEYLDMIYHGDVHIQVKNKEISEEGIFALDQFVNKTVV